jgi:hypothetical protein
MHVHIHFLRVYIQKKHGLRIFSGGEPSREGLAQGLQQETVLYRTIVHIGKNAIASGLGLLGRRNQAVNPYAGTLRVPRVKGA